MNLTPETTYCIPTMPQHWQSLGLTPWPCIPGAWGVTSIRGTLQKRRVTIMGQRTAIGVEQYAEMLKKKVEPVKP